MQLRMVRTVSVRSPPRVYREAGLFSFCEIIKGALLSKAPFRGLLDNLINNAVLLGLIRAHVVVAVGVFFYLCF